MSTHSGHLRVEIPQVTAIQIERWQVVLVVVEPPIVKRPPVILVVPSPPVVEGPKVIPGIESPMVKTPRRILVDICNLVASDPSGHNEVAIVAVRLCHPPNGDPQRYRRRTYQNPFHGKLLGCCVAAKRDCLRDFVDQQERGAIPPFCEHVDSVARNTDPKATHSLTINLDESAAFVLSLW
jgi:hypothetical protein